MILAVCIRSVTVFTVLKLNPVCRHRLAIVASASRVVSLSMSLSIAPCSPFFSWVGDVIIGFLLIVSFFFKSEKSLYGYSDEV